MKVKITQNDYAKDLVERRLIRQRSKVAEVVGLLETLENGKRVLERQLHCDHNFEDDKCTRCGLEL